MCGIAGFLFEHTQRTEQPEYVIQDMITAISHRGPDDAQHWVDKHAGFALGHRRLSILDLSPAGHQPMTSACGRYVIAFNGEIYNHLDLRTELEKAGAIQAMDWSWRGHSDTESLLAGFTAWGIKATVKRCVGMFAFAVWDKKERVLTLGRDRLGEKPLYYGWQGLGNDSVFLFGSELKALKAHPAFLARINRDALCLLMRHNYIPAPHSIYHGIFKLPAGSLLSISLDRREPMVETYWSLTDVAVTGNRSALQSSPQEMVDALEQLLKSAVRQQMVADVPLGAFLSGGIDSSTIVALMQAQSERPVKTFTIGFNEAGYNEAVHAKAVAHHLGTDHTEMYVTPQQAMDVIPKLPTLYCEPFADSSQIPTFLVSQLARHKVTVSLSGDAGDELFAGYNRYVLASTLWNRISRLPSGMRTLIAHSIHMMSPSVWNTLLGPLQRFLPLSLRQANIGDKLYKGAGVLAAKNVDDLYLGFVTHWQPQDLVIGGQEPLTCMHGARLSLDGLDPVQRMMAIDAITYLPDDILVKVDRAAMGVSLEGRVPFLDHRVVEFAWQIPQALKLRDGVSKWILRQVLYRYVPKELIERPKMGFGVPIDAWLRGPLREWAESLLNEQRLHQEGYLNPIPIRQKWAEHLSGKRSWQYLLWDILMFQTWLEEHHA
jgi:asparagine synthase (glutamine-hydrolysing)